MIQVCPISRSSIDNNIAQTNALQTVVILSAALLLHSIPLALFLAVDFAIRGFGKGKFSLIFQSSRKINSFFKREKKMVNGGPKKFAAQLGALFSTLLLIGLIAENDIIAYTPGFGFLICAILEGFWGFCVACKIYPFIHR